MPKIAFADLAKKTASTLTDAVRASVMQMANRLCKDPGGIPHDLILGRRMVDGMVLADGKTHYVRIWYMWIPTEETAFVLDLKVQESSGPH